MLDMFCGWVSSGQVAKTGAILDVGASELFCEDDPESLNRFCRFFGAEPYGPDELARVSKRAYAAELFRRVGYEYAAIDYANFPGIVRLDLNEQSLPSDMRGKFNIVLNCGTSEHIMNQKNVFAVIHDACAVGGAMYHGVPGWGDFEHGIINYTPKFFYALAEANKYEIVNYWGWSDDNERYLDVRYMAKLPFNHRPKANITWLHIILSRRNLDKFRTLNDPWFDSDAVIPSRPSPAWLRRTISNLIAKI